MTPDLVSRASVEAVLAKHAENGFKGFRVLAEDLAQLPSVSAPSGEATKPFGYITEFAAESLHNFLGQNAFRSVDVRIFSAKGEAMVAVALISDTPPETCACEGEFGISAVSHSPTICKGANGAEIRVMTSGKPRS